MKKEVSPELYNYNKFPGPAFALVGDKVVSENIELSLLINYKEAFDQTVFGQRFSQLMLKFDFIVGDWGNEQLRLKGFYKDDKPVASDLKIGRLDD
ncbi:YutD-like domain-containing protein, partial [Streptococcus pyogenes]